MLGETTIERIRGSNYHFIAIYHIFFLFEDHEEHAFYILIMLWYGTKDYEI